MASGGDWAAAKFGFGRWVGSAGVIGVATLGVAMLGVGTLLGVAVVVLVDVLGPAGVVVAVFGTEAGAATMLGITTFGGVSGSVAVFDTTAIGPLLAPPGTAVVISVADTMEKEFTDLPLNVMSVTSAKFEPVM